MKGLDKRTSGDLVRLLIFMVVTTLATGVLVMTIGNLTLTSSREYNAVFSDATGVVPGDDIRIAGVKVGTVEEVDIVDRSRARVRFTVADTATVSESTHAMIRYRNLVGQRYIALTDEVGDTQRLEEGATIPIDRTQPALDLTVLFNGFKPLFQALSPTDLNKLSYEIVQVFQGEGGTLESLLGHTASLTNTLAERDEVISALITNLNDVLDHIGDRDEQLSRLIVNFRTLVSGLKDDREAILASLDQISALSTETAELVTGIEGPFVEDVKQLRRFSDNLYRNRGELDRALQVLPIKLNKIGRTATYGAFFNFYLCHFEGNVKLPKLPGVTVPGVKGNILTLAEWNTGSERCDLG